VPTGMRERLALGQLRGAERAEPRREQIQRQREKGRGVPLRRDLTHGLQVADPCLRLLHPALCRMRVRADPD
jgi:hypothetical protein